MTAQENAALVRSLLDLYNSNQSHHAESKISSQPDAGASVNNLSLGEHVYALLSETRQATLGGEDAQ